MLPAVTMETEASQMLEAALEQMDDIIAGRKSVGVIQKFCWNQLQRMLALLLQKKIKQTINFFTI